MTDYALGAPRMKILQSKGHRPGRLVAQGMRVPDADYPCHALDADGIPLCGFTGQFTILDQTWLATSLVPKCRDCARRVGEADANL